MDTGRFQDLDSRRCSPRRLSLAFPASAPGLSLEGCEGSFQHLVARQDPFLFCLQIFLSFLIPPLPQGWGEPEGWGSLLARLKFAGWEFFRVLIKRNHPERDDFTCSHTHPNPALSSARIHTLPAPPSPRELCKGAGGRAHGKGRILGVCQRAKCRRRTFLAFFPFLVQCCCGCSFPCWFPPR